MDALKFQQVMRPGISVTLSLRWVAADGKLHFAYQSDGARYGSGRHTLPAGAVKLGAGLHWAAIGERGGVWGMRFLFAAYRLLGRGVFTALLYPVVAYFYITVA